MPPATSDMPPQVAVTVSNTGTDTIEAWGVAGEVRYSNGATQRIGVSTDTYESTALPDAHRPLAGASMRLPPGGRATITASVPAVALASATDAAAVPTFAIFENDTAVGDEPLIAHIFERRQLNQRTWRLAEDALNAAVARGLSQEEAFAAMAAALDAADDKIKASVAVSIIRRSLAGPPRPEKYERLRTEIVSRRAAADRHAQRKR